MFWQQPSGLTSAAVKYVEREWSKQSSFPIHICCCFPPSGVRAVGETPPAELVASLIFDASRRWRRGCSTCTCACAHCLLRSGPNLLQQTKTKLVPSYLRYLCQMVRLRSHLHTYKPATAQMPGGMESGGQVIAVDCGSQNVNMHGTLHAEVSFGQ